MFSLTTKIAVGIALAAVMACAVLGWQLKRSWQAEARAIADRDTAVAANVSLVESRNKARAEADAERERAMARQRERDGIASAVADLRRALGDSLGACKWTDEQAKALDEFGVKQ